MKKISAFFVTLLVTLNLWSQPRPVELSNTVIIDTDCAFDDMRAISIILSLPEITVKAILTSDGSLKPDDGAEKVLSLLNEFNRIDIPVAKGSELKGLNPAWRPFVNSVSWGHKSGGKTVDKNAPDLLAEILNSEKEKITIICLGALTNLNAAFKKDPKIIAKIDRIVWFNESVNPLKGFNFEIDKDAANEVIKSRVRMDVISNTNSERAFFDEKLVSLSKQSGTKLASVINYTFSQASVIEKLKENHFEFCDDLVALYFASHDLFSINTDINRLSVRYSYEYDAFGVKEVLSDIIKGNYISGHNVVFNGFPVARELFNYDIRPIIETAIAKYGYEEWKANIMTDEFHGHLGVYSIVGAKMGIRAREIFGVGPDMLEVVTYAGSKPPYSCLTDGIQVSTGATLGMGTIKLATDPIAQPSAIFTCQNRSVRITLKKEYLAKVESDINEGILKFGLSDDGYWKMVRKNAIKYWLEWDRNIIFDVTEVQKAD